MQEIRVIITGLKYSGQITAKEVLIFLDPSKDYLMDLVKNEINQLEMEGNGFIIIHNIHFSYT